MIKLGIFLARAILVILALGTFVIALAINASSHNIDGLPGNTRLFLFLLPGIPFYVFYLTFKNGSRIHDIN